MLEYKFKSLKSANKFLALVKAKTDRYAFVKPITVFVERRFIEDGNKLGFDVAGDLEAQLDEFAEDCGGHFYQT